MEISCLRQLEILSLFKQCLVRKVCTICVLAGWKFLGCGRWNLWACSIFLENLTGDCFVTHAWSPQCVFFFAGNFLLEAGGILSLFNYSWKLDSRLFCYARLVCTVCFLAWCKFSVGADGILSLCNFSWKSGWRLFCYARMESTVCFLTWCKILAWGSCNFELVQMFFKIRLEIVLLRTHGVHCVFSFVLENSCLRQLKFWACAIILEKLNLRLFCYARMVCTVCFLLRWKFRV